MKNSQHLPEKDHVQKVKRSRQPNDGDDEDAFCQLPFPEISDRPEDLLLHVVDRLQLELVRLFADLADLANLANLANLADGDAQLLSV